MELKQFKLNSLILFLREIQWNKGNNCWFTDCVKKQKNKKQKQQQQQQPLNMDMISGVSEMVQTWSDDRYC